MYKISLFNSQQLIIINRQQMVYKNNNKFLNKMYHRLIK